MRACLPLVTLSASIALLACAAPAGAPAGDTLAPLPALELSSYMGRWHQIAHRPNRFQSQCLRDTTADYRLLPDGGVEVTNSCQTDKGVDRVVGRARPQEATVTDGVLRPARLEVAFAPPWLRWLPMVWGDYQVVKLMRNGQVAIVSEPTREYLWVLARQPQPDAALRAEVRQALVDLGFDPAVVVED